MNPPQFEIHVARDADKPRIMSASCGMDINYDSGYWEQCFDKIKSDTVRILFLTLLSNDIAGYCILNFAPKYSLYKRFNIPEIQDVRIHPEHRRQGLGRALILAAEQHAKDMGYDDIGISVGLDRSFGAAQRLYIKLGYVPDGYGVTYDRMPVVSGDIRAVDDQLALMLVKHLG